MLDYTNFHTIHTSHGSHGFRMYVLLCVGANVRQASYREEFCEVGTEKAEWKTRGSLRGVSL